MAVKLARLLVAYSVDLMAGLSVGGKADSMVVLMVVGRVEEREDWKVEN